MNVSFLSFSFLFFPSFLFFLPFPSFLSFPFLSFLSIYSIIALLVVIEIGSFIHPSHPSSVPAPKRHHPPRLEARQPFGGLLLEGQGLRACEAVRLWDEPFREPDDENDGSDRHACVYGARGVRWRRLWEAKRCLFVWDDRLVDVHGENSVCLSSPSFVVTPLHKHSFPLDSESCPPLAASTTFLRRVPSLHRFHKGFDQRCASTVL